MQAKKFASTTEPSGLRGEEDIQGINGHKSYFMSELCGRALLALDHQGFRAQIPCWHTQGHCGSTWINAVSERVETVFMWVAVEQGPHNRLELLTLTYIKCSGICRAQLHEDQCAKDVAATPKGGSM